MIKMYCENTDCKDRDNSSQLYAIELTEDFNGTVCIWCDDCIGRDYDMVNFIMCKATTEFVRKWYILEQADEIEAWAGLFTAFTIFFKEARERILNYQKADIQSEN